jgi:regulatory protein
MGIVTALELGKRDKTRVNVYIDEAFAFSLNLDDAALLRKGQELSDQDAARLRAGDSVARAVESASRFLAHRPRSVHELRHHLSDKAFDDLTIDLALEKLQTLGYVDDRAFAAFWVRERTAFKPLGARALRYELRQKGIDEGLIRDILADLDAEDAAYRAAQPQVRKLRGSTRRVFKQKLGGFLQRRGFAYSDVEATLRRLQAELDADDPAYFAPDRRTDEDGAGFETEPDSDNLN